MPYLRTFLVNCGGINNSVSDELIQDNELADAANIIPDENGGGNLVNRMGCKAKSNGSTYGATVEAWSRHPCIYSGVNNEYFAESYTTSVPVTTFNIYQLSDGSVLKTDTTAQGAQNSWASLAGYDLYVDGNHAFKTSDGTTFTTLSNIPAGTTTIEAYNNYLFALIYGGTSLRYSDQEAPETWDVAHELTFNRTRRLEYLTSIRANESYLATWSNHRMFLIQGYGPNDFTVVKTIIGTGVPNHRFTCATPYGWFWWSMPYGLCRFSEGMAQPDFPMLRKLRATYSTSTVKYNTPETGYMIWRPDHQCVSVYCDSTMRRIDYYPEKDAFYIQTGVIANIKGAVASFGSFGGGAEVWSGLTYYFLYQDATATTGKLYVREEDPTVSTDMGAVVTAHIKTKRTSYSIQEPRVNRIMLTTNLTTGGNITYGNYMGNATSLNQEREIYVGTGVKDTLIGINSTGGKMQHYISDKLSERTKYISLHEIGD